MYRKVKRLYDIGGCVGMRWGVWVGKEGWLDGRSLCVGVRRPRKAVNLEAGFEGGGYDGYG